MEITISDIENYLAEIKVAIRANNYRIARNRNRQDNNDLFFEYVMNEALAKDILLSLTPLDFSEILQNEHAGYEHEQLYVFGKEVTLLQRFGSEEETISLYIKFNKLENQYVIVISFHRQKFPLAYPFKQTI